MMVQLEAQYFYDWAMPLFLFSVHLRHKTPLRSNTDKSELGVNIQLRVFISLCLSMTGLQPSSSMSTGIKGVCAICYHNGSGRVARVWSAGKKSLETLCNGQELNPGHRELSWLTESYSIEFMPSDDLNFTEHILSPNTLRWVFCRCFQAVWYANLQHSHSFLSRWGLWCYRFPPDLTDWVRILGLYNYKDLASMYLQFNGLSPWESYNYNIIHYNIIIIMWNYHFIPNPHWTTCKCDLWIWSNCLLKYLESVWIIKYFLLNLDWRVIL